MIRALVALLLLVAGAAPARAAIEGFHGDLQAGLDRAAAQGRPVFAFFTAGWCEPCQVMKAEVFTDPAVREALAPFVPVEVDTDTPAGAKAWERFKVVNLPTMLFLRPDGTERREARLEGARTADELVADLKAAAPPGAAAPESALPSPAPEAAAGRAQAPWLWAVGGGLGLALAGAFIARARARRRASDA